MSLMSQAYEATYKTLENGDLSVEHAAVIWRNFEGRATKFTPAGGRRCFNLVLTPEVGQQLKDIGWNVKTRDPRDPDDDPLIYTEIMVNMKSKFPPKIFLCSERAGSKSMTRLDEESVKCLDSAEIANMDIIVHPYEHGRVTPDGSTIKGYARSVYATLVPSTDFDSKYADYVVNNEVDTGDNEEDLPF